MSKTNRFAAILITLGLFFALVQLKVVSGAIVLWAISAGLLAMYVVNGAYRNDGNLGFLIPGCILAAIGGFALLNDYNILGNDSGHWFLFMFGTAFLAVMFIHTLRSSDKDFWARYWPIFPASVFYFTGTAALLKKEISLSGWLLPIGLVIAGISVWASGRKKAQ